MSDSGEAAERIVVRRLGPEEWRLWRGLRLRALAESPDAFGSTLEEVLARDEERHWREGVTAPMVPFVAEIDGAPVGMCRLMSAEPFTADAELISVWLAPEARGRGIGRELVMEAVRHHAAHHPSAGLHLAVRERNLPARRLYERCGFTLVGPNPEDADEIVMEHVPDR